MASFQRAMRTLGLLVMLVVAACSGPVAQPVVTPTPVAATPSSLTASPSAVPSASATAALCTMPVWWAEPGNNPGIHGGQISIPGGVVTDNGTLSAMPQAADAGLASIEFYGGTFSRDHVWRQLNRSLVSPDGSSYVYTTSDGPTISTAIHVVDLATNTDAVVYGSPQTLYFPIAYEADGIYLVHAVNPKQGTFENLYRLNPAGGTPQLVSGSDRPMYGWSWVLIADGAAWGIGYRTTGNDYIYSIMRLDLTTSQVTDWMDGAVGDLIWPMGVDLLHRLYVEDQSALWQVAAPGQASSLPDPIPAAGDVAPGYDSGPGAVPAFLADTQGEWFAGTNGIWLYRDGAAPTQFYAGPTGSAVYPGGLAPEPLTVLLKELKPEQRMPGLVFAWFMSEGRAL